MNKSDVLQLLREIIDDARTAVLATADADGGPRMRWVSPALLKGHPDSIFMITSSHFTKVNHIQRNPVVEWMFQTKALTKIVNVRGEISVLSSAAIRSEALEALAPDLRTFWTITRDSEPDMVVLETRIREARVFFPFDGGRETVLFPTEESHGS
jgi:pyridoxamine 5'-phosphate oxidase